jgi:predicted dehydrogenase
MIGVGDVSEKRNGQAFNNVNSSRLVEHWYTEAKELFDNNQLNAIYIGTPASSHMDYAIEASEKGFNIYLEKPAALNADQTVHIKDVLTQRPAQKMTVAHYRRELPLFKKVKELIDSKVIGE